MPNPKQRKYPGSLADGFANPDMSVLTDEEADWVLDRLVWLVAPQINGGAFKAAFGVGCEFGVRDDSREAARAFVRGLARVAR